MITAQTHYRAYFDIEGCGDTEIDCARIAKVVRKWITDREGTVAYKELGTSSFFTKGDWINPYKGNIHVHTISDSAVKWPITLWSLRYEHPDRDHSCRLWVSDVTLQQVSKQLVRFAMHVYFKISAGYLGVEPPLPLPTTPKLITTLLNEKSFVAKAGHSEFTLDFTKVSAPDAEYFVDDITAEDRLMPYVVISEDPQGIALLDAIQLALQLAGNARVFLLKQGAQDRFNMAVGYHLRCNNGMVRVYQPHARNDENDARRHRFFLEEHIRNSNPDDIATQLVIGLVRRGRTYLDRRPISREDVESEITRVRLQQLKIRLFEGLGVPNTQINELAETFEKLLSEAEKDRNVALNEIEYYQTQMDSLQSELDQEKNKLFAKDQQIESMRKKAEHVDSLEQQMIAYKNLIELPESAAEVLQILSKTHCSILEFSQEAHKSAAITEFADIGALWSALCQICKTLPDLTFEENCSNIEAEFKRRTGLELSFSEGKMTKSDKKMVNQRIIYHHGIEYDITPHLKLHKGGKHLRIHFAIDRKKKKIIIGHCGDHLDTCGTRRLS